MPSSCSVPNCKSNYRITERVKVFKFPERGTPQFEQWIQKIPRKDWTPGSRSVVCILHFSDDQIIKEDTFNMPDGRVEVIPRQRFKLVEGAVPCIFPSLPTYLSTDVPKSSRRCPDDSRSEHFVKEEPLDIDILDEDVIPTFECLLKNVDKITRDGWDFYSDERNLTFYQIDKSRLPLHITCSVTIEKNLALHVYWNEKRLFKELRFLFRLTRNKKEVYLGRYSQLENLLSWLGIQDKKVDTFCKA